MQEATWWSGSGAGLAAAGRVGLAQQQGLGSPEAPSCSRSWVLLLRLLEGPVLPHRGRQLRSKALGHALPPLRPLAARWLQNLPNRTGSPWGSGLASRPAPLHWAHLHFRLFPAAPATRSALKEGAECANLRLRFLFRTLGLTSDGFPGGFRDAGLRRRLPPAFLTAAAGPFCPFSARRLPGLGRPMPVSSRTLKPLPREKHLQARCLLPCLCGDASLPATEGGSVLEARL